MWATSLPILIFLGLSVLDLDPTYATDRQTDVRRQTDVIRASSLNAPLGRGIISFENTEHSHNKATQPQQLCLVKTDTS